VPSAAPTAERFSRLATVKSSYAAKYYLFGSERGNSRTSSWADTRVSLWVFAASGMGKNQLFASLRAEAPQFRLCWSIPRTPVTAGMVRGCTKLSTL